MHSQRRMHRPPSIRFVDFLRPVVRLFETSRCALKAILDLFPKHFMTRAVLRNTRRCSRAVWLAALFHFRELLASKILIAYGSPIVSRVVLRKTGQCALSADD